MTYIYIITIGIIQIFILWNWLRIIDTTSEIIHVGIRLKKLNFFDIIINSLWTLSFFFIPLLLSLNENTNENIRYLGLFLTSLLFGKFFWDSILPSFGEMKSLKKLIWMIIWRPIANLISGVLVIKVVTWLIDLIINLIISENIIDSINFGLNFLSDIWILQPSEINSQYRFSLGLVIIIFVITQVRIFPLHLMGWKKIILRFGVFTLILRTIKYIGGDFISILNIGKDYINEGYSYISIITICLGWLTAIMIKKPTRNKV